MDTAPEQPGDWYEIRIQGRLDGRWSTWLDELEVSQTDDGLTVLRGPLTDQAALHGLLSKLRDIGLPLLSVTRTDRTDLPAHLFPTPPPTHRRLK